MRGLRKRYGDVVALDGADLAVRPGQLVGFLGPNGAGKTTTMRAVMRMVAIDGGTITYHGRPVGEQQRRRIGYMPQQRGLYMRMRAGEHVAYVGRLAGLGAAAADAAARRWLGRVGLGDEARRRIESLSSGNQQRVQLAVALVHDPELLILDEPFRGLDPVAVRTLAAILAERAAAGAGVVFSSHQLDVVQDLCEDVTIIAGGTTVAAGAVTELRAAAPWRVVRIVWQDASVRWEPPEALRAATGPQARHTAPAPPAPDTGPQAAHAPAAPPAPATGPQARPTAPAAGAPDTGSQAAHAPAAPPAPAPAAGAQPRPGRALFTVPAGLDPVGIAAAAASAGPLAAFSIEPPTLDQVFVDLVAPGHG